MLLTMIICKLFSVLLSLQLSNFVLSSPALLPASSVGALDLFQPNLQLNVSLSDALVAG